MHGCEKSDTASQSNTQALTVDDFGILDLMVDGADRICEYAIGCWWNDKYGLGQEVNAENVKRWKQTRDRAREIRSVLKQRVKANGGVL